MSSGFCHPVVILTEMYPEYPVIIDQLLYRLIHCRQLCDNEFVKIQNAEPRSKGKQLSIRQRVCAIKFTARVLIDFLRGVPKFNELYYADQVKLIQKSLNRVMVLYLAGKYNASTDTIYFANEQYTRDTFHVLEMGISAENMFNFCRRMHELRVTVAEYSLFMTVVTLSVSGSDFIVNWKIHELLKFYLDILQAFVIEKMQVSRRYKYSVEVKSIFQALETLVSESKILDLESSIMNRESDHREHENFAKEIAGG